MPKKAFATIFTAAGLGGLLGASPFIGWIYLAKRDHDRSLKGETSLAKKKPSFASDMTRQVSEIVSTYNSQTWKSGEYRPNRIILVRHGQTHGYSHTCDCQVAGLQVCALKPEIHRPLTEEGKLQSLQAGVALKKIIGDETVTFFSSPYISCRQTFSYIGGSFSNLESCMFVEDPRLRNQDFGNWNLDVAAEKDEKKLQEVEKVGKFYYRWPNGESCADVFDRTSSFMETLYRKWKQHDRPENFVIITHSSVINLFLMRWFHWDVDTFHRMGRFRNGQVAVLEKQDDGSYRLVTPLPCDPPIPEGVKLLAENPVPVVKA
eukprot:augustus_masked-scaffold_12-processed-gene-9.53-mRNA-1 protein AED:0.12 eAED:0.12 QI:0/-1/0/1/-1/1/1/0/318